MKKLLIMADDGKTRRELVDFHERGLRIFCTQLRELLLYPDKFDRQMLEDICYFLMEVLDVRENYYVVIANSDALPLPVEYEFSLEKMPDGIFFLLSEADGTRLKQIEGEHGSWGISKRHISIMEIETAYQEAVEAYQKYYANRNISPQNIRKMKRALDYIRGNYRKDLNLAAVSNYVSMNYTLFSNMFKKYTGMTFVSYLREIRIRQARYLLENSDMKVAEVGMEVGYENDKHFMKVFKSVCGMSPTEYRCMQDNAVRNMENSRE